MTFLDESRAIARPLSNGGGSRLCSSVSFLTQLLPCVFRHCLFVYLFLFLLLSTGAGARK